jgi:hypothetical protein
MAADRLAGVEASPQEIDDVAAEKADDPDDQDTHLRFLEEEPIRARWEPQSGAAARALICTFVSFTERSPDMS